MGRLPLTPEEKEQRRVLRNKIDNERKKVGGWKAQKKYRDTHKNNVYDVKVRLPIFAKEVVSRIAQENGVSINQLFISAVEEKYGVILLKPIDKTDNS